MTDTPIDFPEARMAEMLALAPLQPTDPPKDRVFYARQHVPMKWTPYKPTSQEVKRGKEGRWQQRRAYGLGWENAGEEPQAGAWIEDVINHPDRRLASQEAWTRQVDALDVQALASVIHDGRYDQGQSASTWTPFSEEPHSGKVYCLRIANAVVMHLLSLTPPSDAGGA